MININKNKSLIKAQQKSNMLGSCNHSIFNQVIVFNIMNINNTPCSNLTKVV